MAPLMHNDGVEEKSVPRTSKVRFVKPVVPVIPRAFEKKPRSGTKIAVTAAPDLQAEVDYRLPQDMSASSPEATPAPECSNNAGDWASYVDEDTNDDKEVLGDSHSTPSKGQ